MEYEIDLKNWPGDISAVGVEPDRYRCNHCGTEFTVKSGLVPRMEAFRNMPPAAATMTWAVPRGQRLPDFDNDPVVHECKRGVPITAAKHPVGVGWVDENGGGASAERPVDEGPATTRPHEIDPPDAREHGISLLMYALREYEEREGAPVTHWNGGGVPGPHARAEGEDDRAFAARIVDSILGRPAPGVGWVDENGGGA